MLIKQALSKSICISRVGFGPLEETEGRLSRGGGGSRRIIGRIFFMRFTGPHQASKHILGDIVLRGGQHDQICFWKIFGSHMKIWCSSRNSPSLWNIVFRRHNTKKTCKNVLNWSRNKKKLSWMQSISKFAPLASRRRRFWGPKFSQTHTNDQYRNTCITGRFSSKFSVPNKP